MPSPRSPAAAPAYVFYFLEAMEKAAPQPRLRCRHGAPHSAVETFIGARLAAQSSESLATLAQPRHLQGRHHRSGPAAFDAAGVAAGIERGIAAADARGRELGDILGKD
jgi:pyrroline-5-carboxylate reductase